ncbi:glycosyltransferase family 1 protein [Alteribacter natronophilus]|uniref:glycosyltransferase family 1 protein n=1 Tax=Alteribacter natronophilus TaxID=2583810 RepID=UPI00110EA55C|nr:glycosyltransferase family 1 protein [Alteribacter natronophilus]TMW70552.1 glycosyltransferase family 1 protein [Alteribacter natronophilus]
MGNPVRVLHVVVNMNRGGAETLLMNLYRNIDRSKVQFDFLTCKEGMFDSEIESMGGRIHRIPYITEAGHFGFQKALNSFFSAHPEYSIVHSHLDKMSGIVLREAKRNGLKVRIAHSHNTGSEGNAAVKLYKWYAGKQIDRSATHFFACSDLAGRWLFNSAGERNFRILKNGIRCDEFAYSEHAHQEVREELGLQKNDFVIGHVGRFNHQKNHAYLIDLFVEIRKTIPRAKLILAGDGDLRTKIEKKVNSSEFAEDVHFLGVRQDIQRLLQGMDLFLFPSLHEGLPVTLVEAQGAGLPCLISDVISREVDMGAGLVRFLPLHDRSRWIDEVRKMAEIRPDRNLSHQPLAASGYDIRHTADWSQGFYLTV